MFGERMKRQLATQDWPALSIELIIVVFGVFLAFQVDRLYESRKLQSEEQAHLVALRHDFEASRRELVRVIDIHMRSADAASQLILDENFTPEDLNYKKFYQLLGDVQRIGTPNITRRTYDLLISSGKIDTLQNDQLKDDIDSFYALSEGRESYQYVQQLLSFESSVFVPYVIQYLDHVALVRSLHFDEAEAFDPPLEENHFRKVLGTPQFEGVVTTKWHLSVDYVSTNESLLRSLDNILQELDENLRAFD